MLFSDLTQEEKINLHKQFIKYANSLGGVNSFLTVLEEIRAEKPKPLLNKTAIYHTKKAKLSWGKTIFKDTLEILYSAMRNEEKHGNMFNELAPNDYKKTMNMVRATKPVEITLSSKENNENFSFNIFDTSVEKNTKFTITFKIFFLYHPSFAKELLLYKIEEK